MSEATEDVSVRRVPMARSQEALVAKALAEHAAAIRAADEAKNALVGLVLDELGIPRDVPVRAEERKGSEPAYLVYDA